MVIHQKSQNDFTNAILLNLNTSSQQQASNDSLNQIR